MSSVPRRNQQGTMSGSFLCCLDRTARSLRVVHYSSAVNKRGTNRFECYIVSVIDPAEFNRLKILVCVRR